MSTLSSPWVEVLVLGDHVMICEDGELVAAGSILALPRGSRETFLYTLKAGPAGGRPRPAGQSARTLPGGQP